MAPNQGERIARLEAKVDRIEEDIESLVHAVEKLIREISSFIKLTKYFSKLFFIFNVELRCLKKEGGVEKFRAFHSGERSPSQKHTPAKLEISIYY